MKPPEHGQRKSCCGRIHGWRTRGSPTSCRYVKLADAGHFLPVEAPDDVAKYLWSFIDDES